MKSKILHFVILMTNQVINLYDELPDFANKENRNIHSAIIKKNAELKTLQSECSDLQSRVSNLSQHLNSIKIEIGTSQDLLSAKVRQTEEEKHLQQLCDREQGKIASELSKLKEQTEYINAKVDAVQYKTNISQKRISEFNEESKENQQELEQWITIARQKEEDYLVLQQYHKEDEKQIRTLLSDIEKATSLIESKKAELDQEITATRALQIELNITAEHFRKMHEERSKLLSQWEQTLQQMQNLNESIEKMTNDYESRKSSVIELQDLITEQGKVLEAAELSNQDLDRQAESKENEISQKSKEYESESISLSNFTEKVESQRHQLEKIDGDCRYYQGEINNYKERIAQEKARKEGFLVRLQGAQAGRINNEGIPAELNELNDLLKKSEDELSSIESRVDDEKNQILKLTQEIYETRKNEKKMIDEIQSSQIYSKNLNSKLKDIDKELQKQLEQLYGTNMQIQQMERKIGRQNGERSEEEKIEIQLQINELQKIYDEKLSSDETLQKQLDKLNTDLNQAKKKKEELEKVKNDLAVKFNELRLDQETIEKSIVQARSQKETVLVQLNMLKLQVEKLSSQLASKSDEQISSEKQKQLIQFSMMERIGEIDDHLAALRTQLKTEEEARHTAQIDLNEMKKQRDLLQTRYESMIGQIGEFEIVEKNKNSEDKDGCGEIIQPCYIIQFAKERDEVNLKGDQLEEELKIAIKELRGLEKAMEKLTGKSISPSKMIEVLNNSGKITNNEKKTLLEEQIEVARQKLSARKEEAQIAISDRQKTEELYEYQQKMITELQNEINQLKPVVEKINFENKELNDDLKKATFIFTKNKDEQRKKALNNQSDVTELKYPATVTEMNVEYRILRSIVDNAVNELSNLVKNNREIEQNVSEGLAKIGILTKLNTSQKVASNSPVKNATIVKPKTPTSIASSRSNSSIAAHSPVLNKRVTGQKVPNISKLASKPLKPPHIGPVNK